MKVLSFLVLIAIFAVIESSLPGFTHKNCTDYMPDYLGLGEKYTKQAYSKDFCASLHVKNPTNKCCYLKYKDQEKNYFSCYEVTEDEFWNIKKEIDDLKSLFSFDVKNLICDSSSYLTGSLFLFLLYLF